MLMNAFCTAHLHSLIQKKKNSADMTLTINITPHPAEDPWTLFKD